MSIRDRIRKTKHLRNRHLICVLENPNDIKNVATVIRNLSAFGVEKLYIISNKSGMPHSLESSRKNKFLTRLSVGANKWIFIKRFTTTDECALHLKKIYTPTLSPPLIKKMPITSISMRAHSLKNDWLSGLVTNHTESQERQSSTQTCVFKFP